jgi:hypothetical protein
MFFNGFTLLLMTIAFIGGFAWGLRVENQYQRTQLRKWINGETIEEQMKRDGWAL